MMQKELPMRAPRRNAIRAILVLLSVSLAAPAFAQGKRKKLSFDEDTSEAVVGQVQKPEVGYIITRLEQEDLETLQLKENFIPKISRSLEKTPF
jgi:hypothetical protein